MLRAPVLVHLLAVLVACGADAGATTTSSDVSSSGATTTATPVGSSSSSSASSVGSDTGAAPSGTTELPEEPWRIGDPDAGWDALLYGSNTGGGVPIDLYLTLPGPPVDDVFHRDGVSAQIPWFYNAYEAPNGVTVASPSCLACHASRFAALGEGVFVGLGNAFAGSRLPSMAELGVVALQVENTYGADSPEAAAFQPFYDGVSAVIGHAEPPMRGSNAAFMVEEAAIAHRDPQTQAWLPEPRFAKTTEVLASDVPPWWHMRKKHALYYNGMGRGDAARLLMQSSVMASFGLDHLVEVDATMPDVVAFLRTIEAPAYPGSIDADLAAAGEQVFVELCADCHGTYGESETYPNLLVDLDRVGTDPAYAEYFMQAGRLADSYDEGWFATGEPGSRLQPEAGYVAPPLDGIWATAPYFHNGSVPTLAGVLDSSTRPTVWLRDFVDATYDVDAPGLAYTEVAPGTADAYDTSVRGYGNGGHVFADGLDADARTALLEYLRTL